MFMVYMVIAFLIFALSNLILTRLEYSHPQKYKAMGLGKPSFFSLNAKHLSILGFVIAREHKKLNDSHLSKLSDTMLATLIIYLLLLFLFISFGP